MYKEHDRYKKIEELESTQMQEQKDHEDEETQINLQQLQNQSMQENQENLSEILDSSEGKTVYGTLNFLSKVSIVIFLSKQFARLSLLLSAEVSEIRGRT